MERSKLFDKIYACWLGKNIGGTLGTPVEGCKDVMHLTWYPRLDPKGALPNDDLDLQLVNLHAMEQYGVHLDAAGIAAERFGSSGVMATDIIDCVGLAADSVERCAALGVPTPEMADAMSDEEKSNA